MQQVTGKLARISAVLVFTFAMAGCDIAVDGHGGLDFGLSGGKATDQWTRTYQVAAGGRLELINVNGRITAEASDGTAVEVLADRTAKATTDEGAKELLGRIEMREEVGADRVRVEVRAPRMNGPSGHEFTWTVKVPRGISVDLRTVNGAIRIANLDGDVRARSTNGGIKGTALLASSVDAAVTNGGIEIDLGQARERRHFRTRGGQRRCQHQPASRQPGGYRRAVRQRRHLHLRPPTRDGWRTESPSPRRQAQWRRRSDLAGNRQRRRARRPRQFADKLVLR